MEKLFDENNEFEGKYYRTVWYGYIDEDLNDTIMEEITAIIKTDLTQPPAPTPVETSWVFYGAAQTDDAIGDKVRTSLMVRERNGKYAANYNISDFDFVTAFDIFEGFKMRLLKKLNS